MQLKGSTPSHTSANIAFICIQYWRSLHSNCYHSTATQHDFSSDESEKIYKPWLLFACIYAHKYYRRTKLRLCEICCGKNMFTATAGLLASISRKANLLHYTNCRHGTKKIHAKTIIATQLQLQCSYSFGYKECTIFMWCSIVPS